MCGVGCRSSFIWMMTNGPNTVYWVILSSLMSSGSSVIYEFLKMYDMVSGLHLVPLIYLSVLSSVPIILICIDFYVLVPNKKSWTSFAFMEWIQYGHNLLSFFYVPNVNMLMLYLGFLHLCSSVEWFCDYFFSNKYVWFWYQGYTGLIECLKKCSLFSYSIEDLKWYWNYLFL